MHALALIRREKSCCVLNEVDDCQTQSFILVVDSFSSSTRQPNLDTTRLPFRQSQSSVEACALLVGPLYCEALAFNHSGRKFFDMYQSPVVPEYQLIYRTF